MAGGSKAGSFFLGMFLGLIFAGGVVLGAGYYLMQNPQKVMGKVTAMGKQAVVQKQIQKAMARTVNTIPKSYVSMHQGEIIQRFEQLTTAYSMGTLTADDIFILYSDFFDIAGDGKLKPEEVDAFLSKVDKVSLK